VVLIWRDLLLSGIENENSNQFVQSPRYVRTRLQVTRTVIPPRYRTKVTRTVHVIPPRPEMRAAAVLYLLLHNSVVRPALLSFGYNA
jgi:hypothetical protein